MKAIVRAGLTLSVALVALMSVAAHGQGDPRVGPGGAGSITGHVKLLGKLPGNLAIRMGADPKCAAINAGKLVIQQTVVAALDGSLQNVFARLVGSFPTTTAPPDPVILIQRDCMYSPRVIGMRVGQNLQVRNDDDVVHNVHGFSRTGNGFNFSQPQIGMVRSVQPGQEEAMLRVRCDIHSWMTAFVGVVNHPYFGVSDAKGMFTIRNVPAGTYGVEVWHEKYGLLTQQIRVTAGAAATLEFAYPPSGPAAQ